MTALPKGTELESFIIDRVLGQGGFGITYLASDATLERHVAIKEYFPQMWAAREGATVSAHSASTGDYNWGLNSFIKEAKTLARFRHPSIVHVNRTIEANGTAYMVLDYEEGDDFGKWLEKLGRPPTQDELDGFVDRLLGALSVVHRNRILHRDIAPDNIKIRKDGTPVLLDFGAAREAFGHRTGTMTGLVKHGYSPVEQYSRTGKDQGPWTDIYALGATLYRAVTGAAPPESIDRLREDALVPTVQKAQGAYRPGFLAAIDHALERDPANRPQSVAAWKKELFAGRTAAPPDDEPHIERPRRRSGWKWAAALVLVGLLGAGGYYVGVMRPAHLAQQQDEQSWNRAKDLDTVAAYRTYLTAQPQGRHAAEAQQRIAALEEAEAEARRKDAKERRRREEAAARERRDNDAWTRAERQNTVEAYRAYLTAQPQGRYSAEANARIAALEEADRLRKANAEAEARRKEAEERRRREEAAAQERRDNDAWARAEQQNSIEGYRAYLTEQPQGRNAAEANARIAALEEAERRKAAQEEAEAQRKAAEERRDSDAWARAEREDSIAGYRAYLREQPQGQHTGDARQKIAALEEAERRKAEEERREAEERAKELQPGREFQDCAECPRMVVLPAGQFLMGSPQSEPGRDNDENPQHEVTIAKPFAVGKFEVTFAEWDACVADGGCNGHRPKDLGGRGRRPVMNVSWDDARAYVAWLARKTGKDYRLLSEAEWEYAARAGAAARFHFGDNEAQLCDFANGADSGTSYDWRNQSCSDGVDKMTAEVGRYKPNAFGLHDMHGNLWEWVEDCWNDSYAGAPADGAAWETGKCDHRVLRGGSWLSMVSDLRAASRGSDARKSRLPIFGFRVASSLDR